MTHTSKTRARVSIAAAVSVFATSCQWFAPPPSTPQPPVETTTTVPEESTTVPTTEVAPETTTTTAAPTTTTTAAPATTTTMAPTTTVPPAITTPSGWSLLWSDEFDAGLDTSTWKPYHSTYGDGNNELQCHTPNNVEVSGGTLKIDARRENYTCPGGKDRNFTSGFLGTRETGTYFPRDARYEVRAKIPHAQGLWPAFWLRHRNGSSVAEVDVMEYFHSQVPGKTTQTLHLDHTYNISKRTSFVESPDSNGWHTWAVEIEHSGAGMQFRFYTDDVLVHSYTDTSYSWANQGDVDHMFDMALNLSVGGNWVGHPDDSLGNLALLNRCAQGGTYPNNCKSNGVERAQFDETYEVDYVRVFER